MAMLARLFTPRRVPTAAPSLPDGVRVYAIGDVHGEAALLAGLLKRIEDDNATRGAAAEVRIILLGDLIDRGPASALLLRTFASYSSDRLIVLRGNHEAAMLQALDGGEDAVGPWLRYGGASTLASFGVPFDEIVPENSFKMMRLLRDAIPGEIVDWLRRTPLCYTAGDYFFVHAGIRPGVHLAEQATNDMLWIREGFIESKVDHGAVVVHGHTIEPGPVQLNGNRIGLDTGAYLTGHLAALGLEGQDQWIIDAVDERFEELPYVAPRIAL